MTRKDYEEQLVVARFPKGGKLTPSKKVPGGLSPLVHGKGPGVKSQAVLFPVKAGSKKRSVLGSLLAFATKSLLVVLAVGAVIAVGAVLVSAVVDGVAAGLADVGDAISAASEYLVLGAGVAAVIAVSAVGIKVARFFMRRRTDRPSEHDRSFDAAPAAVQYVAAPHYGNEAARTHHAAPAATSLANPADWFPDPSNTAQSRYWNGTAWTHHVAPRDGADAATHLATTPSARGGSDPAREEPRLTMSSAEWQAHVRAWMAAGAVEQELWRRLSNAQVSDADQLTLDAQQRMEQLTAEQGTQQIRMMLEANPDLRDELGVADFLTHFLRNLSALDRDTPVSIDRAGEPRRP